LGKVLGKEQRFEDRVVSTRVFLLGGAGLVGQSAAEKFAKNPHVTEILIAGRNTDKARNAALAIGDKANAAKADATNEEDLAQMISGYDILVNASGPDYLVQPPCVKAAVKAGIDYCDVSCDGPAAAEALKLDRQAKSAGMTAIIGIGWTPGLDNLMMVHAARQLDEAVSVHSCIVWPMTDLVTGDARKVADDLRNSGPYAASWETGMRCYSGKCQVFRDGGLVTVNPSENEVVTSGLDGRPVRMYPACGPEPITIPRYLQGIKNVSLLLSFTPFPLNELAHTLAQRINTGEIDTKEAAVTFIETAASDRDRWLVSTDSVPENWPFWVTAEGIKDGSRVRYTLKPDSRWMGTGGPLYTAAMALLDDKVGQQGVLPPEACFDPIPFMEEVASIVPGWPSGTELFEESFEDLDLRE
jgi:lysine 6-dehydrogenase